MVPLRASNRLESEAFSDGSFPPAKKGRIYRHNGLPAARTAKCTSTRSPSPSCAHLLGKHAGGPRVRRLRLLGGPGEMRRSSGHFDDRRDHLLAGGAELRPRLYHLQQEFVGRNRATLCRGRTRGRIRRCTIGITRVYRASVIGIGILSIRWLQLRAASPLGRSCV